MNTRRAVFPRAARAGLLCAALALLARGAAAPPAGAQQPEDARSWAFAPGPDSFRPDALLDLRSLNEKTAGESGFVKADAAGDFTLGNGQPVRFWAVNTNVGREKPFRPRPRWPQAEPDLSRHARFLAKRGVNMVRLHAHVNPDLKANPGAGLAEIHQGERDWIWRTVAAMKKEGIYTTVSPYWANTMQLSAGWGVPGGAQQSVHGLLFFDEKLQEGYRAWLRALFAEKNPYTGIPLARDPALALIQLQNEDSLLFWTVNNIKGEQRSHLGRRFAAWLGRKHGSLAAAFAAWGNDTLPGDDRAAGVVDFHNIWEMTQSRAGGRARRLDDQLQFWAETMHAFNQRTAEYLRGELGCGQLVNAGNWKSADMARLNDAERWSYTANEVLAVNHYFGGLHVGPHQGWAIVEGDRFTSKSALLEPRALPVNLRQVKGRPMLVTESAWVMPNGYAAEAPFLVSAYQSLTGVDAFYWFATGDEGWTPPQSANGYLPSQGKWLFANPDMLGGFPAAALMFRKAYIRRGAPVLSEHRALADLWQRRTPVLVEGASFDPNRDAGNIAAASAVRQAMPPEAFLVGPAEVTYDSDPARTTAVDLKPYFDPAAKRIRSITGEIALDYGAGWCTVDTPGAQGAAAFFRNRASFKLADVEIRSGADYGVVCAVSMDGKPLASSGRILVQAGTRCRPTGWKEVPAAIEVKEGRFDGFRVESFGRAPWQVTSPRATITIANPALKRATVLDPNGYAAGQAPLARVEGGVRVTLPDDALYTVLE